MTPVKGNRVGVGLKNCHGDTNSTETNFRLPCQGPVESQPNHSTFFHIFLKMGQSRPLFVYFHSFLVTISIQIEKSVDGVLGIRTRGRRLVGADVLPHLSFYKFKQTNVGNVIAWKYDIPELLVHHFPCLKKEFSISEFSICGCLNIPPAL